MKKRFVKQGIALFAAASMVAGLSMTAVAEEPVTIVIWGWNAGTMDTVFNAYLEETGANVVMEYVPVQQEEAFQKLQTTLSAGLEMPDIVPSEVLQRGTMLALDIWEDLSAEPYNFDISNIYDYQVNQSVNSEGKLVALPWDISSAGVAYKKNVAEEWLGVSEPEDVEALFSTWDEFLEKGIEVKEASDGKVFMFAGLTNVKQLFDSQNPTPMVKDGKLDMTSPNQTLEWMIKFRDAGIVDNILETSTGYSASYADDTHIFYPCASWSPTYTIAPNDPEGAGRWGLISPPGGCFSWGGSAHMIPSAAEHKQEAYDFISWLISDSGAIAQRNAVGFNITAPTAYDDPEFAALKDPWFGDQNIGELLFHEAMDTMQARPVNEFDATFTEVWVMITEAINSDPSITLEQASQMFEEEVYSLAPELMP